MTALYWLLDTILRLTLYALIVWAVLSWLVAFNVVNPYNKAVRMIMQTLSRLIEPLCRPIRRILPDVGGIDFSPLIVALLIEFSRRLLADGMHALMVA